MLSVSQKIRTGVLELRTPNGSLYINPSFWERLYLLWIFRNFRSLSRQVLSLRQQRLMDRLCRTANILELGRVSRGNIIGAIENARAIPSRNPVLPPATTNLVEIPAPKQSMPLASAVGAPTVMPLRRPSEGAKTARSVRLHASRVTEIFARHRTPSGFRQGSSQADLSNEQTQHRQWVEWVTGAALAAVLFGVLLYVRELRPWSLPPSSRHSVATRPVPVPHPALAAPGIESAHAATPPVALLPSANSPRLEAPVRRALVVHPQSAATPESPVTPRLHVFGAPEHSFTYPEAPDSALTGAVSLRAVIGSDGAVKHIDILSGKPVLARAAIQAVRSWRYSPPQSAGEPVEADTRVMISFMGDDAVSVTFPPPHD